MKRSFFVSVCITTQIAFVVLYIHKSNKHTQQSYHKQQLELAQKKLEEKQQSLIHQLYVAKNQNDVKEFAQKKLGMTTVNLKHIKPLQYHE